MHLQDPPSFEQGAGVWGGGAGREVASLKPNHRPFRSLLFGLGVGRGTEQGIIQKANGEAQFLVLMRPVSCWIQSCSLASWEKTQAMSQADKAV